MRLLCVIFGITICLIQPVMAATTSTVIGQPTVNYADISTLITNTNLSMTNLPVSIDAAIKAIGALTPTDVYKVLDAVNQQPINDSGEVAEIIIKTLDLKDIDLLVAKTEMRDKVPVEQLRTMQNILNKYRSSIPVFLPIVKIAAKQVLIIKKKVKA